MSRCFICDSSDNLDGVVLKTDSKTGNLICLICWESIYDALDDFYSEDEVTYGSENSKNSEEN